MSDDSERSVASAGSVAGEPVAWAALRDDGDVAWIGYTAEGAADGAGDRRIVPLYRHPQPAITDAEREAAERGYCSLMGVQDMSAECSRWDAEAAATLRGLLERLK